MARADSLGLRIVLATVGAVPLAVASYSSAGSPPATPFEEVTGSGLEVSGDKDGGVAWVDIDGDGCLDAAVNTVDTGTHLLVQDGCSLEFRAAGTLSDRRERSVVLGDLDGDGRPDLVRNGFLSIDIHLNVGGAISAVPDQTIGGSINSEGIGLIDYDLDGDLDILTDDHQYGIAMYENDPLTDPRFVKDDASGLPDDPSGSLATGDYLAVGDYDVNGVVDAVVRREGLADVYVNSGGTFAPGADLLDARNVINGGKGGVSWCDVDDDGDFDLFWTDGDSTQSGSNEIWRNDAGSLTATGEPSMLTGDIDGVSCGDVDNDGDADLVVSSSVDDQLIRNDRGFSFTVVDLPATSSDGEGLALGDADRDGDLDLLVNQDGDSVLLRNTTDDDRHLTAALTTAGRTAMGAVAWLETCTGARLAGVRQLDGGSGHGSQDAPEAHFGGVEPDQPVVVVAIFVGGAAVQRAVVPDAEPAQRVAIDESDEDDLDLCAPPPTTTTTTTTTTATTTPPPGSPPTTVAPPTSTAATATTSTVPPPIIIQPPPVTTPPPIIIQPPPVTPPPPPTPPPVTPTTLPRAPAPVAVTPRTSVAAPTIAPSAPSTTTPATTTPATTPAISTPATTPPSGAETLDEPTPTPDEPDEEGAAAFEDAPPQAPEPEQEADPDDGDGPRPQAVIIYGMAFVALGGMLVLQNWTQRLRR